MREKPGGNCYDGVFPPRGEVDAGEMPFLMSDIKQGSLAHEGHVGASIPEAHVKVLIVGPALSLVGHWIRGG